MFTLPKTVKLDFNRATERPIAPSYPKSALEDSAEGVVLLNVVVDKEGKPLAA